MAVLYLVRHAQASFGAENYDQLSENGIKQSAYLPVHFKGVGMADIDTVYTGSMQRHKQTLEHSFPQATAHELPGLNEFDHEDVLRAHRPEIFDKKNILRMQASGADVKTFIRTEFQRALLKWVQQEEGSTFKEPFQDFKKRCISTLYELMDKARKENKKEIVAVTSGGFISLIMTHILEMPEQKFSDLNLIIANTSVTSLLFKEEKISLAYFNNYRHLPR